MLVGTACQSGDTAQSTRTATSGAATQPAAAQSTRKVAAVAVAQPGATTTSAMAAAPSVTATSDPAPSSSIPFSAAIRQVVQRVRPAVVQITNEQQVQAEQFDQPFTVPAGVGSGVIYDTQGHILTNNHVVEGAQQLLVSLPDGQSFPGKLIGRDPLTDLAVVQISGANLPVAQLGDSGQMQAGDWVVAIGNALGLQGGPTVSEGVVSAVGRTVQEPGAQGQGAGPYLFDVIQTDAPINPGNSGGPLVNLQGQVIGINTLVAGQAEPGVQAQGIGFAIALATAKPIADQLVATGHVTHPFLGISYFPLNPAIAAQLGIKAKDGVVVRAVDDNSPAAQAGLQPKDVITAVDGKPLQGESALAYVTNAHRVGDTLTLTVLRGGKQMSVPITLGPRPAS
jgi:S1-C subfamily serine protease